MQAQYVAVIGDSKTTHMMRAGWRYDALSTYPTRCGRTGVTSIQHYDSGKPQEVTCRNCGASRKE